MTAVLHCYGVPFAVVPTYRHARPIMEHHIRTCPKGEMPWARRIRWHRVRRDHAAMWAWGTACNGEWLDHRVEVPDHVPDGWQTRAGRVGDAYARLTTDPAGVLAVEVWEPDGPGRWRYHGPVRVTPPVMISLAAGDD